jgi:hypothetical protein
MKNYTRIAAAVLLSVVVALPMFAEARGSANFSTFVALGDSFGVGHSNNSMNERHQIWSWPAVIARQVGLTFCQPGAVATDGCWAQPLITYPGIGPELVLTNLSPTLTPAPGQGVPVMLNFGRPYNNLSIPGATVGALLQLTGGEPQTPGEPGAVTIGRVVLRGLGTPAQQVAALHPTFVAMWIGGNDYLSIVSSGTPATLTPAADFKLRYEMLLDQLIAAAPNAGMVVGNLPYAKIPYLTLVPPVLVDPATRQPIPGPGGAPIFYIVDNGDGTSSPVPPGTLIPLHTRAKIAMGYGLPAFLKAVPPFNQLPHVGEPLLPNDVITPAEMAVVETRVAEYNTAIQQAAAARNIPVADIAGLYNRVFATGGLQLGPINVNAGFLTGGFFSYDGVHLTDLGYLLFGNEFIKAINAGYGTEIPLANIFQLAANNGALFDAGFDGAVSPSTIFSSEAIQQIQSFWAQPTVARRRVAGH